MLEDKRLDKDVPIPLYFQLEKLILEEIDNGNYPVGSMIPTEMELSQMFGISRTTVRQAISDLVREEHLYRIKSKGTFVAHPKLVQGFIQSIQSFDDDVRSTGRTPSTEVLDLKLVELEPEVAQLLELPAGTKAIYLYRKRFADDEPIVRVETYLPYEACSFILGHDFNRESLYQVLSKRDDTRVTHVTPGKIVDKGIQDANNMGAAMAPAAYDTIQAHFRDTGRRPSDYDLIVTGDLGSLGKEILLDLFHRDGIEFKNLEDCGVLIYDAQTQDVHCGGSGCGCSAAVLTGFLLNGMREGRWKKILFCGTGALLSPTSTMQGESIPGICHAVAISTQKGG